MDKVVPGQDVTRGEVPVNRKPEGHGGGVEFDPRMSGNMPDGVNITPKPPRTDPETYGYKVDRSA